MSSPAQAGASAPRATLTDLPKELLRLILSYADRASAIALARVSRTLTQSAEVRIWRDVNLSLNPHHGEYPLIRPHIRTPAQPGHEWSIEAAKAAEMRHRAAIKEKVRDVIKCADHRRCGMVKSVRMEMRPGAAVGMLQFLDLVSKSVTSLEVVTPARHDFDSAWLPFGRQRIDLKSIDSELHLPFLTHLTIGRTSPHAMHLPSYLCERTPNLVSLTISLEQYSNEDWGGGTQPPLLAGLKDLRIECPNVDGLVDEQYTAPIVGLLARTPHVQRLSIKYEGDDDARVRVLGDTLAGLAQLQELDFQIACTDLADGDSPRFSRLRRAVYSCPNREPMSSLYPVTSSLEAMYFSYWPGEEYRIGPTTDRQTAPPLKLYPMFVEELRTMPRLRIMHSLQVPTIQSLGVFDQLDDIEKSATVNGMIHSVRHGDYELFHCRFLSQYAVVADHPIGERHLSLAAGLTSQIYTDPQGNEWEKLYLRLPEALWRDYTDFEGELVPLEVIGEMRAVEGKSEAEWKGRGISVGGEAWKVLTDWHEGVLAAKEESGPPDIAEW